MVAVRRVYLKGAWHIRGRGSTLPTLGSHTEWPSPIVSSSMALSSTGLGHSLQEWVIKVSHTHTHTHVPFLKHKEELEHYSGGCSIRI